MTTKKMEFFIYMNSSFRKHALTKSSRQWAQILLFLIDMNTSEVLNIRACHVYKILCCRGSPTLLEAAKGKSECKAFKSWRIDVKHFNRMYFLLFENYISFFMRCEIIDIVSSVSNYSILHKKWNIWEIYLMELSILTERASGWERSFLGGL